MKTFLRNVKIRGIKNLCEPIELLFCKKEILKINERKNYNVKAIYGPNGSGKTAIVHAFRILKELITESGYLHNKENNIYLSELMNKSCKHIEIEVDFFYFEGEDSNSQLYTYSVRLDKKKDGFEINYEKLSSKASQYSKDKVFFKSVRGELKEYSLAKSIEPKFTNLLTKGSFVEILNTLLKNNEKYSQDLLCGLEESYEAIKPLIKLVQNMKIILDVKDQHQNAFQTTNERLEELMKFREDNLDLFSKLENVGYNSRIMNKTHLGVFLKENIKKLEFIRIFKPEIVNIDVIYKTIMTIEDEDIFSVNEFTNYGDYTIDLELESVGIKKLITLYNSISFLVNGGILIIYELDSHFNDIYLVKIMNFVF